MEKFVYCSPTKIVFGRAAEEKTADLVKECGGSRVFLIYGGQSAVKSGLIGRIEKMLADAGIEHLAMGGVVPNPLVSTARKMAKAAIDFKADFILGVGGGSVMDTAKAVAHTVASPEHDLWDFWSGTKVEKSTPVGAVLTISAAGSETSNSSVLTNDTLEAPTKRGINTEFNRPKFAVMNPELTMTLPKYQIGAGAADIFMHTHERYFPAILGNHLTDEFAEGLFRDIIKYGPIGVNEPDNYEAMSEIMWCGSVSHVGLTGIGAQGDTPREGDWACHQLGMAISVIYDSTHGATLTAVWAAWCRYVMKNNVARFAQFARKVYGINVADDQLAADMGIDCTNEFFKSLGMPLSLTELLGHEPTDEEIEAIAWECTYGKKRTIGSFASLGYDDIVAIYKDCR